MTLLGVGQGLVVPTILKPRPSRRRPTNTRGRRRASTRRLQQLTAAVGVALLGIFYFGAVATSPDTSDYVHAFTITCRW